jgi:hypothetical protein
MLPTVSKYLSTNSSQRLSKVGLAPGLTLYSPEIPVHRDRSLTSKTYKRSVGFVFRPLKCLAHQSLTPTVQRSLPALSHLTFYNSNSNGRRQLLHSLIMGRL